jgi:Type IV secretion system pilin
MSRLIAQITNPALENYGDGSGSQNLGELIGALYSTAIMVGGLALFIYLIWGGINWLTAGGNEKKLESAKDTIVNAIIGMALLIGVAAIVALLSELFGIDLLNPVLEY